MDINYNESLPSSLVKLIKEHVDDDTSQFLLQEINNTISLEYSTPPLVDEGKTFGNWTTGILPEFTRDYRNYLDQLSFEIIEQMIKSSPVRFAVEMKRAQIVSVFRNQRSWKINCIDKELGDIVRANLINILSKMALDFSYSSLVYGASFQELVWEYKTKAELGLQEESGGEKYIVAKVPNSIDPKTIDYIKRDKKGHFDGFVQKPISVLSSKEIVVERESALVIPYNEKWRNLWGESFLAPMYPIWFWYEVVLRSMVKYMERTGTPVVKVRAPSRATVTKPGTKIKVDGISWGMEIGSNLPRSNTVVIPSDRDEQGNPLWEIDYMSSTERAQPFMDILELLFQMILRAGLSADRALSQSSGGVGSYSIGEIHKEATALHNEMILIQWVYYLNQYFLPLYSLYNRGTNGPVITIETQGLDPFDRDNLKTILGVMQGSESFKDVSYKIDWDSLFTTNNVPTISDEEADARKKKQQEESLSNQENMLSVQSKFSTPSPTKQADGSLKANIPTKPPEKKLEVNSESVELEQIDLFNPYHDRGDGRFTSGRSGLGGLNSKSTAHSDAYDNVIKKSNSNIGTIFRTTGTVLGIGGLGVVGLVTLAKLSEAHNKEQKISDIKEQIEDTQNSIDELTKDWPKSNSKEEAIQLAISKLKDFGITEIPEDIKIEFTGTSSARAVGEYHADTNTLFISPEYEAGLLVGDPATVAILLHELAHSEQEHKGESDIWGNSSEIVGGGADFGDYLEGQNDLVAMMSASKLYNQPIDQYKLAELSSEFKKEQQLLGALNNRLNALNTNGKDSTTILGVDILNGGSEISAIGYPDQSKFWAGLAKANEQVNGIPAKDFLTSAHKYGFSQNESHQDLVSIFPEEMKSKGFYKEITETSGGLFGFGATTTTKIERKWPSQSEVRTWMAQHNYTDPDKAFDQMIQEAMQ